jgi:hypothetical protein
MNPWELQNTPLFRTHACSPTIVVIAISASDPSGTDEARPSKGRGCNFTAEECFILSRAWVQQSRAVDEQNEAILKARCPDGFHKTVVG